MQTTDTEIKMRKLSNSYSENVMQIDRLLRVDENFDMLKKLVRVGDDELTFYYLDGFVKDGVVQKLMLSLSGQKGICPEKSAGEAQEILLVRLLVGDSVDRVAAVKTDSGVFVLDLTDHVWDDNEPVLYEVEEFVSMLDAKEEERAEGFWEAVKDTLLFIGASLLGTLLLIAAGIALVVVVIIWIVRKLIRKRRSRREE
jgi:hypothetical protein